MKKTFLFTLILFASSFFVSAQDAKEEEDTKRMFREVVDILMDKPAAAASETVAPATTVNENGEEVAAPVETSTMPAPASELIKRANAWYNAKNIKYVKSAGVTGGNKVGCVATFNYKPKELNPAHDVEGEIVMNVSIECKDGKYRYTVDKLVHKAKKAGMSGGDIYNNVAECGSMKLGDMMWKQIKSTAFSNAKLLVDDLKQAMKSTHVAKNKNDW